MIRWLTLALAATLLAGNAYADATATLRGRVTDAQEAALPGATVTLRQAATGAERETLTDARGSFVVSELPPGDYVIEAAAPGFAKRTFPAITLRVGQYAEVRLALAPAALSEKVEVQADALTVQDLTSVVGSVLGSDKIEQMPLNGRNFLELAFLVPGNAPAPNFDPTKTNSVVVSSAGQLGRGGNITVDGADNNDDVVGGTLQNLPQDAIQEFQIATSRFSAEIGRSAGSAINVVTRSGGDEWKGTAAFYLRDDALQSLPATFDESQSEAPGFSRKQYALSAGGPVVKDKLFWFGAVEYRDQDGAVLVGRRDSAARAFVRDLAPAPLTDFLGTTRLDFTPDANDRLSLRYSIERAEDTGASTLDRALGSASQRQTSENRYHSLLSTWTHILGARAANTLSVHWNRFRNSIDPVAAGPQLTYPSLQDGSSFRVPQGTDQSRFQVSDSFSLALGNHGLRFGGEVQKVGGDFHLGVFREGRVEFVQDFPGFDANGDGVVDDNDLLFAVTLRSGFPDRDLDLKNCDSTHLAGFVQDDWRVTRELTLNLGLRYELDSNVKNISGYGNLNPITLPFLAGERKKDMNNWGPRIGFNLANKAGDLSVHGGYGIYYDRVTLEIISLERGLDGRALPIEVRAGNLLFLDPQTGQVPPFAPSVSNPFSGFILPGAGASGLNIIDNRLENPSVQQFNLGFEKKLGRDLVVRVDGVHALGSHFIIGRTVGTVFNPVVGGPDRVVNLESSVGTHYDGLLVSADRRFGEKHWLRAAYTLSKASNYANDDQIPFSNGPLDPNDLQREYGPTPNDQRHRFTFSGSFSLPWELRLSPLVTLASPVPMDILMPDAQTRVPSLDRNAGGRRFHTAGELNAFIAETNASGGIDGVLLPSVSSDARFGDSFKSVDLRLSRRFQVGSRAALEALVECFNVFNTTNILGLNVKNYSGYANVLVRDSDDPSAPGYLTSSSFGKPVTTAGGVFGSGGPRAVQLGVRLNF
jgi:Carboxypeptidase regulatory-like domain